MWMTTLCKAKVQIVLYKDIFFFLKKKINRDCQAYMDEER